MCAVISLKNEVEQVKKKRKVAQEKLRRIIKAHIDEIIPDKEHHRQKKLLELEL